MPTPEKLTRVSVFVPSHANDQVAEIADARAPKLGFRPRDPEILREAIMRGLAVMRAEMTAGATATKRNARARTGTPA